MFLYLIERFKKLNNLTFRIKNIKLVLKNSFNKNKFILGTTKAEWFKLIKLGIMVEDRFRKFRYEEGIYFDLEKFVSTFFIYVLAMLQLFFFNFAGSVEEDDKIK